MRHLLLIALVVLVGLGGCKKYDEGPVLSLRTPKARLMNDWVRDREPIDCILIYSDGIEFFQNGNFDFKLYGTTYETGKWKFEEDETVIDLTFDNTNGYNVKWKILRLAKKELWVINKCTLNGDEIELEYRFTPVKE